MIPEIKNRIITAIKSAHAASRLTIIMINGVRTAKDAAEMREALWGLVTHLVGLEDITSPALESDGQTYAELQLEALNWIILHSPTDQDLTIAPLYFKYTGASDLDKLTHVRIRQCMIDFSKEFDKKISFKLEDAAEFSNKHLKLLKRFINRLRKATLPQDKPYGERSAVSITISRHLPFNPIGLAPASVLIMINQLHAVIAEQIAMYIDNNPSKLDPFIKSQLCNMYINNYAGMDINSAFAKKASIIRILREGLYKLSEDKTEAVASLRRAVEGYTNAIFCNRELAPVEAELAIVFTTAYNATRTSQAKRILYNVGLTLITLGLALPFIIAHSITSGKIGFFYDTDTSKKIAETRTLVNETFSFC